jgi:acyl-ACP thioesterase
VEEIDVDLPQLPIAKGKIPKLSEADFQSTEVVKWFCLDTNNHVNHIHYFRWIMESLPVIVHQTQSLKILDIIMKSEATLGESLTVQAIDNQDDSYTHQILNEDGKVVVQALSTFGNL